MSDNIRHLLKTIALEEQEVEIQASRTPKEDFSSDELQDADHTGKPAVAEIPAASEDLPERKTKDQGHQSITVSAEDDSDESAVHDVHSEITEDGGDTVKAKIEPAEAGGEGDVPESDDEVSGETPAVVSQEGFTGGLLGWIVGTSTFITPGISTAIHGAAKAQRDKLRGDIQEIAKRIAKVRAGEIEEVKKKGIKLPKDIENPDWNSIIKGALIGTFFGPFYGTYQGHKLQQMNNELQAKLRELESLLGQEGVSTEDLHEANAVIGPEDELQEDAAQAVDEHINTVEDEVEVYTKVAEAMEGYCKILASGVESKRGVDSSMIKAIRLGMEGMDIKFDYERSIPALEDFDDADYSLTATSLTLQSLRAVQVGK